jgi:hypothetical protein
MKLNEIQEESFSFVRFTLPKLDPNFNGCLFTELFPLEEEVKMFREDDGYFRYHVEIPTYKLDSGEYSHEGVKKKIIDTINETFTVQEERDKKEQEEKQEKVNKIESDGLEHQDLLHKDFSDKNSCQEFVSMINEKIIEAQKTERLSGRLSQYEDIQSLLKILYHFERGYLNEAYLVFNKLDTFIKEDIPDYVWEVLDEFYRRNLASI